MSKEAILILGCKRGLGLDMIKYLTAQGQTVVGIDRESFTEKGVLNYTADVTDQESLRQVRASIRELDIDLKAIVYNVGNNKLHWLHEVGIGELAQNLFDSNVVGIFNTIEVMLPLLKEDGRVVLLSSIAADIAMRTTAPYCATKAAVDMLTKCFARELAPRPVFCIKPGPTEGDNSFADIENEIQEQRGWDAETVREMTISDIPMGKMAIEREISEVLWYLLEYAPTHLSGTTISVTGGRS